MRTRASARHIWSREFPNPAGGLKVGIRSEGLGDSLIASSVNLLRSRGQRGEAAAAKTDRSKFAAQHANDYPD